MKQSTHLLRNIINEISGSHQIEKKIASIESKLNYATNGIICEEKLYVFDMIRFIQNWKKSKKWNRIPFLNITGFRLNKYFGWKLLLMDTVNFKIRKL